MDIVLLEVGEVLSIVDWFVITSAANPRQVRTIAEEVEEKIKVAGGPGPLRTEGFDDLRWVLLDYGDFVVHVDNGIGRFVGLRLDRARKLPEWRLVQRQPSGSRQSRMRS